MRAAGAAAGAAILATAGVLVFPAPAPAQPEPQPEIEAQTPEILRNITYRARVDGVSRGASITYRAEGDKIQAANPTMVPGRVFEAMAVLPQSQVANMRVSIEWPYSANLHCEILVDDQLVAQADDFIAPRVLPQRDDPDYGALTCEAPVGLTGDAVPVAGGPAAPPPPDAGPPDQPAPPPA